MNRRLSTLLILMTIVSALSAQVEQEVVVKEEAKCSNTSNPIKKYLLQPMKDNNVFQDLDVSVTAGSTGYGLDISSSIGDYVRLRAGVEYLPSFEKTVNFGVQVGEKQPGQTEEEYKDISNSKFAKLSDMLIRMTGQKVEDNVDMVGEPSFSNAKLLVDVYPLKQNRHWHFTAGIYWGGKRIAKAYNTTEDMPTLYAVNLYNTMYDRILSEYYLDHDLIPGELMPDGIGINLGFSKQDFLAEKFEKYGRMGLHVGDYSHDIYSYDEDGNVALDKNGEPIVLHKAGDPYMMEPDEDCMVKVNIKTNRFKPYLGVGYGTDMAKSKSGWGISFDAGLLFWGGSPSIVTHDGTDLVNDLTNVRGKVGTYVDFIKQFKVYPVLQFRLTKRLF